MLDEREKRWKMGIGRRSGRWEGLGKVRGRYDDMVLCPWKVRNGESIDLQYDVEGAC